MVLFVSAWHNRQSLATLYCHSPLGQPGPYELHASFSWPMANTGTPNMSTGMENEKQLLVQAVTFLTFYHIDDKMYGKNLYFLKFCCVMHIYIYNIYI